MPSSTPWDFSKEPTPGNVTQWLSGLASKFKPIENVRWTQSNIDTMFYAGNQQFVNSYFNYSPQNKGQQYYFNLIQQPVNMVTGFQRQHRKSINYIPTENSDPNTTDQYTKLVTHIFNANGLHEQYSKGCELATISGKVLLQPYLDFSSDDQAQGEIKIKIWEYNSFLVDPYYRSPDMSDAQFVWCQEFISKNEAEVRFQEHTAEIRKMNGSFSKNDTFYFLPENYSAVRQDLLILSYVWYKSRRRKKRLYSEKTNQFFDFSGQEENLEQILASIPDLQSVEIDVPTWKCATVLNEQMISNDINPLGFDDCPFIPIVWNYDPHIADPNFRVRSLVRTMRDSQFLFNRKIIMNNEITEATINAGWKRKGNAVANVENLKKTGQGWDVIINEGYEMSDVEKIVPSGVPDSDIALAQQMMELVQATSGINMENWSGQEDSQISSLTALIKQAANLLVFQKYFDQWDFSLKLLGERVLQIILYNWNAAKVGLLIGEQPTAHFFSRVFAKYHTIVEEGLLTPTQQSFQARQMLEINQVFGREVLPPSMIIEKMNIQGKAEIMEFLQNQEQQASAASSEMQTIQHAFEEAKLQELYSKAVANIARAREDHSRSDSNLGLYEERLSMIERNKAITVKDKQAALTSLLENLSRFGEIETAHGQLDMAIEQQRITQATDVEKQDAERRSQSNQFIEQILGQSQQVMAQSQMNPQSAEMAAGPGQ